VYILYDIRSGTAVTKADGEDDVIGLSQLSVSNLGSGSEPVKSVLITLPTSYVNGGPEPDEPSLPGTF
jgi:hypothetical protein